MPERQHAKEPVRGFELVALSRAVGARHEVRVGHDNAFGTSGRTGRVNEQRIVCRRDGSRSVTSHDRVDSRQNSGNTGPLSESTPFGGGRREVEWHGRAAAIHCAEQQLRRLVWVFGGDAHACTTADTVRLLTGVTGHGCGDRKSPYVTGYSPSASTMKTLSPSFPAW